MPGSSTRQKMIPFTSRPCPQLVDLPCAKLASCQNLSSSYPWRGVNFQVLYCGTTFPLGDACVPAILSENRIECLHWWEFLHVEKITAVGSGRSGLWTLVPLPYHPCQVQPGGESCSLWGLWRTVCKKTPMIPEF